MLSGDFASAPIWNGEARSLIETEGFPLHAIDDTCGKPGEEHEKEAILERDQVAGLRVKSLDRSLHHLSHALRFNSTTFQVPQEALTHLQAFSIRGISCGIPGKSHRVTLPETRARGTWFDDDDLDAKRRQFATERVREAFHTVFGGVVGPCV